jgi:hypothetical protein
MWIGRINFNKSRNSLSTQKPDENNPTIFRNTQDLNNNGFNTE